MKFVYRIFEKVRPTFEEGGKLSLIHPLYEAIENFFFAPAAVSIGAPYGRDPLDVKRYMTAVIIGLLPCVLAAFYFYGLRFLPMIRVSYGAGFVVELLFAIVRKEKIAEGFLVTGLIFPLVLPPTIPLWMLAVGVMFGVCIGKELFGGTGRNIFNPAIVGRVFLALAYPSQMSGEVWVKPGHGILGRVLDYVTIKTPTGPDEGVMATVVKFFSVNADGVRSFFTVEHIEAITSATPLGLAKKGEFIDVMRLAIGEVTGSIGETSGLMVLCGGIFLLITRVANWRTVVSILLSAFIMAFALHQSNPEKFASPTWHMFAGGLLFGAFFMATDPVSSPNTNGGKYVYGILIGAVAMLIRNFGAYTEGVMFSILLGNIFAPVIDEIFFSIRIRRLKNEE